MTNNIKVRFFIGHHYDPIGSHGIYNNPDIYLVIEMSIGHYDDRGMGVRDSSTLIKTIDDYTTEKYKMLGQTTWLPPLDEYRYSELIKIPEDLIKGQMAAYDRGWISIQMTEYYGDRTGEKHSVAIGYLKIAEDLVLLY